MNQLKNPKSNLVSLGRVQVPSKAAPILLAPKASNAVTELDSMIGNLQLDLNQQGVNVVPKGDCDACGRAIAGKVVTALGKTWHPEHFTCAKCYTQLGDTSFFERDGLAYCEEDYHRLYSPKCYHCNGPILDVSLFSLRSSSLNKTYIPIEVYYSTGENLASGTLLLRPLRQKLWR